LENGNYNRHPQERAKTGIDLLSTASKLYATILKHKLNCCDETVLEEEECGFRDGIFWMPYAVCNTFWKKEVSLTSYPHFFCL
jgi:hypothetical protein